MRGMRLVSDCNKLVEGRRHMRHPDPDAYSNTDAYSNAYSNADA